MLFKPENGRQACCVAARLANHPAKAPPEGACSGAVFLQSSWIIKDYPALMQVPAALEIPGNVAAQLKATGHMVLSLPIPAEAVLTDVFAATEDFFRTSFEEKMLSRLPGECGYRPSGIEYSQSPERPDQIESFTVSPRSFAQAVRLKSRRTVELHTRMMAAFDILESVVVQVVIGGWYCASTRQSCTTQRAWSSQGSHSFSCRGSDAVSRPLGRRAGLG